MPEVQRYRARAVEIEALLLAAVGDFQRAQEWINSSGGKAHHFVNALGDDNLAILSDGNILDAHVGWYVVRGVSGEFRPVRGDVFEASYEAVEEPENLTGTGAYALRGLGRPNGGTVLVGGAAKRVVHDPDDWGGRAHF